MRTIAYSKRLCGRMQWLSPDRARRSEVEVPDGARLDSEAVLAPDGRFREQGTIVLAPGSELHFRTLGAGSLGRSPDPELRHGTVTWEVYGGTGRLEDASGHISSTFTLTEDGRVDDDQHGLIFVSNDAAAFIDPFPVGGH